MNQEIIFALVALLFSALFSGIEIAFISANRLHIELQAKKGGLTDKILSFFLRKPSYFIGTTLIGNTIALVLFSTKMAGLLNPYFEGYGALSFLVSQTVISTLIVLVFAEYLPKSLFLIEPNRVLSFFALPFSFIALLLSIPVLVIVNSTNFLLEKIFKASSSQNIRAFSLTDLNNYIQKISPIDDKEDDHSNAVDTDLLNNALEFHHVKVRDCMVPRIDLIAVDHQDSIEELRKVFIDTGFSKILVFKETIDNIIGYVHSSVLFKKPNSIEQVLTKLIIVTETKPVNELLAQFTSNRRSIALVVDEFGGTSGIITMEDVVEEIFGEIHDEHDEEDLVEDHLDENSYLFSARHEVEYLNEKYLLKIPKEDYDTLGGYILHLTEDIPKEGDVIETLNFKILIKSMEGIRIDKVQFFVSNA